MLKNFFKNKAATVFFGMLVFFLVPFGIANYLYRNNINLTGKTVNHGVLLQPLLEVFQLPLQTVQDNTNFNTNNWRGHWVLMYVYGQSCDDTCKKSIYYLRQIRLTMGKDQDKIMRAYVAVDTPVDANMQNEVALHFAGTDLLETTKPALTKFLNNAAITQQTLSQGQLFIVDPQGYVMMRYPVPINAEDVYKDLTRLLKINS